MTGAEDAASVPWRLLESGSFAPQYTSFYRQISTLALPLPIAILAISAAILFIGKRYRLSKIHKDGSVPRFWTVLLPYLSLALTVGAVARSVTLAETDPAAHIQPWEVWAWLAVCSAVLIFQAALLSFGNDTANSEHLAKRMPGA
ncbi:MAG TPA: hypothetical protein VFW65_21865 [Pseudonocardiaceae bacterium]|nr:hypothetical protein [Pseudonocardiaceae bacterium]